MGNEGGFWKLVVDVFMSIRFKKFSFFFFVILEEIVSGVNMGIGEERN